jgi:hypothetical protein
MSKRNDPAGTAIRAVEHPRVAWLIRKAAVLFTIRQYRLTAKLHKRFQNLPNYKLFRYEDLLADPEKTLKELCKFIEVEFHADMLEPEKGVHEHQPSSLTGKRQKAFDPTAAIRWRRTMSPLDCWIVTSLTRSSMRRLGYNPKTHLIFKNGLQCQETKPSMQEQSVF